MSLGVGQRIGDFSLPTLDGNLVTPEDIKGKKTLIFVWGSW